MTDDAFLAAFENAAISREDWRHADHVRMAWLYLTSVEDFEDAVGRIREGIHRLNEANGVPSNKYHETITLAFAILIRECIGLGEPCERFEDFAAIHPELLDWDTPLPLRFYSRDRLFSEEAYREFVEPDILELPRFEGKITR